MVRLGFGHRSSSSWFGNLGGSTFACSLGLFCLSSALSFVCLDLGLDALLGFNVVEFLSTLTGGFLDLFLALKFFLGFL